MNEHIFVCNECNISHDCHTKDGLIDTIAHKIYHTDRDFGIGAESGSNRLAATNIVEQWEKLVPNTPECLRWREDNDRFEGYLRMYEEHRIREKWPV